MTTANGRRSLADRYSELQRRRHALRVWSTPEMEEAVKSAVERALSSVESFEGDDVEIGIASPHGFRSPYGDVVYAEGRDAFSRDGDQILTLTSRAVGEDGTPLSPQQLPADTGGYAYDEVVDPPWNMELLQRLMTCSTMHASAVETKSSDYAYSGWKLNRRKETLARLADGDLNEDEVAEAQESVENFLRTCADGSPIEDVARDAAIELESLGTCGWEVIRDRGALVCQLRAVPFRTCRFLSRKSDAYQAGARFRQQREGVKRYFTCFGDNVAFAEGFNPATAPIEDFPDIDVASRRIFVAWKDQIPNAMTGRREPRSDETSASELLVMPRRPFTLSDLYGTPSGVQALGAMLALRKIEEYNLQFFEAKGVPQYAIVIKGLKKGRPGTPTRAGVAGTRGADDIARLTRVITEYFTNRVKQSDRSVLVMRMFGDAEVVFQRLSSEKVEASFAEYEDRMKEDIRMSHRIPPAAMGINEQTANIGSGRDSTQMRRYRDHIVAPGQRHMAANVNRVIRAGLLIPYFDFAFEPIDLDDAVALRDFKLECLRAGAITVDEMRENIPGDFPPLGKADGGDVRIFPPGATLVGQDASAVSVAGRTGDDGLAEKMVGALRSAGKLPAAPAEERKKKSMLRRMSLALAGGNGNGNGKGHRDEAGTDDRGITGEG